MTIHATSAITLIFSALLKEQGKGVRGGGGKLVSFHWAADRVVFSYKSAWANQDPNSSPLKYPNHLAGCPMINLNDKCLRFDVTKEPQTCSGLAQLKTHCQQ